MAKNIVISNSLPHEAIRLIPGDFSLDYNDSDAPLSKAELISRLKGRSGLICHIISTIDDEVLAAAPTLKVVANVAVGYNNIDVATALGRGDVNIVVADRDVRDDLEGRGRRGRLQQY